MHNRDSAGRVCGGTRSYGVSGPAVVSFRIKTQESRKNPEMTPHIISNIFTVRSDAAEMGHFLRCRRLN
jgi:hypothetical protein